jgi:addiction module HigA family antidote
VTNGAKVLGVARHTLSRVLNGQAGISAEMAIRLEKAGWSNADHWLRLRAAYDLAQARQHQDEIKVRRYQHYLALSRLGRRSRASRFAWSMRYRSPRKSGGPWTPKRESDLII